MLRTVRSTWPLASLRQDLDASNDGRENQSVLTLKENRRLFYVFLLTVIRAANKELQFDKLVNRASVSAATKASNLVALGGKLLVTT